MDPTFNTLFSLRSNCHPSPQAGFNSSNKTLFRTHSVCYEGGIDAHQFVSYVYQGINLLAAASTAIASNQPKVFFSNWLSSIITSIISAHRTPQPNVSLKAHSECSNLQQSSWPRLSEISKPMSLSSNASYVPKLRLPIPYQSHSNRKICQFESEPLDRGWGIAHTYGRRP